MTSEQLPVLLYVVGLLVLHGTYTCNNLLPRGKDSAVCKGVLV